MIEEIQVVKPSLDGFLAPLTPNPLWQGECGDSLAARWPEFVDYPKRLETEAPFLLGLAKKYGTRILDAAMGIGCESVFLTGCGLQLTSNEISGAFQKVAAEYARGQDVVLNATSIDWRDLAQVFPRESFDLTLVLGNSLCLLSQEKARMQAVENFRQICAKSGAVVVDQRNFDYILDHSHSILTGHFRYTGKTMYCGSTIKGRPVTIDPKCVRFVYEDVVSNTTLGYLDMYPFRRGELVRLFQQAGFKCSGRYSDLKAKYDPDADFYTYVFEL